MKNLALAATAVAAVLTLIAGCASPTPPAPSVPAKQVHQLWKISASLVGTPTIVDDTIVSYAQASHQLVVAAWNLADGKLLWSADATTSSEAPGIELSVRTVTVKKKTFVAFLTKRTNNTWPGLVVADVRTGPRKKDAPLVMWASSTPRACSDGNAFCVLGYRPFAPRKQLNLRIDPLAPALKTERSDGLPPNSRLLGYDIFATETRPPHGVEHVGRVQNGKITWQRPYTDVYGKASSSDYGWAWRDTDGDIIAGIGYPELCTFTTKAGEEFKTCDDTHGRMVGLNHDTGATVWTVDGVDTCPSASMLDATSEDRIIICRNTEGSSTYRREDGWWELQSRTRRSELIAIKHQTGEILWHTDLGTFTGTSEDADFVSSDDHLLLKINDTTNIYDLDTGEATPADATSQLMCVRTRPPLRLQRLGEKRRYEYNIGTDVEPCDGRGRTIADPAVEWVPEAGIDAGDDRWLLPTPGSMTLVELT
ncbi:MAG TPA: PQQ-binding-like beta-propeller repeat protein [Propionicimonas sp.]|nr:PQQ-binding-like beta-propeller repeat protein [Propionicimonas sp.]